jgi:exodeoxyribonuclease-5
MDWSPKQQAALEKVQEWMRNTAQVFRLFGYAGTGKTTLAKHIAELAQGDVLFAAFTGKAALVLQQKGCWEATTIHRLIYQPRDKSAKRLHELQAQLAEEKDPDRQRELQEQIRRENSNLSRPAFSLNEDSVVQDANLVVIDEVSMVGEQMGKDLLSFGTPVLVLGDTAQLPPVAEGGYFTAQEPDVLLDEIHRQAADSPIIRMATSIREGYGLEYGDYAGEGHPTSRVMRKGVLNIEDLAKFDQVLVGTNATRKVINNRIRREALGRTSHLPEPGDRLVCLRNNHEIGFLNGSLWDCQAVEVVDDDNVALIVRDPDGGAPISTIAWRHHFEDREKDLAWWQKRNGDEFDFGYALTCHKAQGSQWRHVAVVDESYVFKQDRLRWLYTAVTRASESVTVLR